MSKTLRMRACKLLAATLAISSLATIAAGALDESAVTGTTLTAVLSSSLDSTVGTVLTSDDVVTAEQALAKAKAKAAAEAAAKAEAEARAKAEAAAKAAAQQQYNNLLTAPIAAKTVAYSDALLASSTVKEKATALGNYRLSFYCDCAECNGHSSAKTASGTTMAEGRTIAVDSRVIPLGSRVYIDGYGVFIAEDTGGAIKGNRLDVCVSDHSRAYELGIKYADIYLLA